MQVFTTHKGTRISGDQLQDAINKVADDCAENARAIKKENAYASHVTEKQKEQYLSKGLEYAEHIRLGNIDNFTIWQRVNNYLTGECVAFLP